MLFSCRLPTPLGEMLAVASPQGLCLLEFIGQRGVERELAQVRQNSLARDDEELELGVRCMAAGIYDDQGRLVAGLSVSAPADRLEESWADRVRATAAQISESLGHHAA